MSEENKDYNNCWWEPLAWFEGLRS